MSIVHVERDGDQIVAVYANPQGTTEPVPADDPEVMAFLNPPPPPEDISDRQFAQGLTELGLIAEDEAEEWVASGVLPAAILDLVGQLPEAERFAARMLLRGATKFEFAHPLAEAFAQLSSPPWSTEARADFWRHCATL